jgi:hypothetical protein
MFAPIRFRDEALREDGVAHDAGARGDREKRAHLGLHVGGESRVGFGGDVRSDRLFGAADDEGGSVGLDPAATAP